MVYSQSMSDCPEFTRLKELGIEHPCEWCIQHIRHIHDLDSWDMVAECIDSNGHKRFQRFNGNQTEEMEMFALDRLAELMVRFQMKRHGEDYNNPSTETIRDYMYRLLSTTINRLSGELGKAIWLDMLLPRKEYAHL